MTSSHAYIAPPLSRASIRSFARGIRQKLAVDKELRFPAVEFVELVIPAIDNKVTFEVVDRHRCPDHGLTFREGDRVSIWIREDVYEGACAGKGRDRGTCAHEGGHYWMHVRTPMLARSFGEPIPTYRDPEWQAKAFQGELLVPFHLVRGMGAEDVAASCGVSLDCARMQLKVYGQG